jgi:DNA invertase Pin-like site-specific DNA recombinase
VPRRNPPDREVIDAMKVALRRGGTQSDVVRAFRISGSAVWWASQELKQEARSGVSEEPSEPA